MLKILRGSGLEQGLATFYRQTTKHTRVLNSSPRRWGTHPFHVLSSSKWLTGSSSDCVSRFTKYEQFFLTGRSTSSTRTMASNNFTSPEVVKFLDDAYQLIKEEALQKGTDRNSPVVNFKHPHELQEILDLEITPQPTDHDALLKEMKKIVQYSVKSGHPHFHNQLYAGLDPYSQAGAWLTETLNANIHTFETCPVFIVMEKYLFQKLSAIIGFENGDGLFCPGGSASNFFALHLARFRKFPEVKTEGLYGLPRLRCYVSEDGHYSLKKACSYLGIGVDNVVPIKTDKEGRILAQHLDECIQQDKEKGYEPLFVMATSASTVFGAFDNLNELSAVCKQYGLFLHCDACWGGGALLSKKHRHLMEGVEKCDSVAWNFHKFSGAPVQTGAFILNDKNLMEEANSVRAEYLFQPDKFYDTSYDIGDKTVQCGRKVDIVKLWVMWKALGDDGMEARVDKAFENARYLQDKIKATEGFRLVIPEFQCTNTCFWYIPPRLRGQPETEAWWADLGKVAPKIKERMVKQGTMMIGYNPLSSKKLVNFFRVIIHNPACNHSDMDFIVSEMERLGKDL